jgi:hypothetical protein
MFNRTGTYFIGEECLFYDVSVVSTLQVIQIYQLLLSLLWAILVIIVTSIIKLLRPLSHQHDANSAPLFCNCRTSTSLVARALDEQKAATSKKRNVEVNISLVGERPNSIDTSNSGRSDQPRQRHFLIPLLTIPA